MMARSGDCIGTPVFRTLITMALLMSSSV